MARLYVTLLAAACAAAALYHSAAASPSDEYPLQADKTMSVSGILTAVDRDRERVTLKAADGHLYAVDVYQTKIILGEPSKSRSGSVSDLSIGTRVKLQGYALSDSVLAADRLSVLPAIRSARVATRESDREPAGNLDAPPVSRPKNGPPRPTAKPPAPLVASTARVKPTQTGAVATPKYFHAEKIRLRGTVDDVDDSRGIIMVRVADHMRTISVSPNTDLTDIRGVDDTRIGVSPGERITVLGTLAADGTVRATAISRSKDIEKVATKTNKEADDDHHLIGQVSKRSDRLADCDIKIRVRPNREVGIEVGHDVPITKHGHRISVHDLTTDDVIRVQGAYDGDDFRAQQIEVLEAYPQD